MSITFDPHLLLWLQQVAANIGLESESLRIMKLQLKYQHRLMIMKKSGVRPQKIPL